jgi:DNA-binding MarR family transcriptional regulator
MTDEQPARPARSWIDELNLPKQPELVTQFARVQMFLTQAFDRITLRAGVSSADYLVLGVVCRSPQHRSAPTRVCELLGRTTGGLTPTLDRLEAAGLLRRLPDPNDRRRLIIEATADGIGLHASVNEGLLLWQASLGLDESTHEALSTGLNVLIERLEAQPATDHGSHATADTANN